MATQVNSWRTWWIESNQQNKKAIPRIEYRALFQVYILMKEKKLFFIYHDSWDTGWLCRENYKDRKITKFWTK